MALRIGVCVLALLMLFAGARPASANTLGLNITIADGNAAPGYTGIGQGGEDNETEGYPPTLQSQSWDLEGMFLNGNSLAMVGGFKFDTGVFHNSIWYTSGDILFNVIGQGFAWDYAIRMKFDPLNPSNNKYDVLALNGSTTFENPTDVPSSTPYKVKTGYTVLSSDLSFSFSEIADSGFSAWESPDAGDANWQPGTDKHYVVSGFDVGFLSGVDFKSHFTMLCGNDVLDGQVTVPEPSTILLLAFGMASMGIAARRRLARVNVR
jgi:PEP-CTERM motif